MPRASELVGWKTKPSEYCVEVSGCRFGLPPLRSLTCRSVWPVTGSSNWDDVASTIGWYRSTKVGARKPVPYEPRSINCWIGCQRTFPFQLVVEPKSL